MFSLEIVKRNDIRIHDNNHYDIELKNLKSS